MSDSGADHPTVATALDDETYELNRISRPPDSLVTRVSRAVTREAERYDHLSDLGRGGMGEVQLCRDQLIGRQVAMKVMRDDCMDKTDLRERFLREARVQARLEHPSVVPVHELGVTEDGRPYFTMRRIAGHALDHIINGLRHQDPLTHAQYGRRKLLRAFSNLCLAVEYAHQRGVVHRDLKPGNVMLGDFGEVYLLDWGIAKILDDTEEQPAQRLPGVEAEEIVASQTLPGVALGSPGYMAPEQAVHAGAVDARADIYSLGAILYEMLTLSPLRNRQQVAAVLREPGTDVPSSSPHNELVPPELDAICQKATAANPDDRFPTARALHAAIDAYLDGEQNVNLKEELAKRELVKAQASLLSAHAGGAEAERFRGNAVKALGRVLALDPQHDRATEMLDRALTEKPEEMPAAAGRELTQQRLHTAVRSARFSALSYGLWLAFMPLIYFMGVLELVPFVVLTSLIMLLLVIHVWLSSKKRASPWLLIPIIALGFITVGLVSPVFGPFVVVPSLTVMVSATVLIALRASGPARWLVMLLSVAAVGVPHLLALLGVIPPSYVFEDGVLKIRPVLTEFPPVLAHVALIVTSLASVIVTNVLIAAGVEALARQEKLAFTRSWRLRNLLPSIRE